VNTPISRAPGRRIGMEEYKEKEQEQSSDLDQVTGNAI